MPASASARGWARRLAGLRASVGDSVAAGTTVGLGAGKAVGITAATRPVERPPVDR